MTFKKTLLIIISTFLMFGCTNSSKYSGNVYSSGEAKTPLSISYGTLISMTPVYIQDQSDRETGSIAGTIIGGVAAATTIGGGSGRVASGAVGALVGGILGDQVAQTAGKKEAYQFEIKKDDGKHFAIVQTLGDMQFTIGQRVRIVGNGNNVHVTPQ